MQEKELKEDKERIAAAQDIIRRAQQVLEAEIKEIHSKEHSALSKDFGMI